MLVFCGGVVQFYFRYQFCLANVTSRGTLVPGFPLFPTDITDIQILLSRHIVRHIDNVALHTTLIARTRLLRTRNHLDVRQRIVLPREFINHNLKSLR